MSSRVINCAAAIALLVAGTAEANHLISCDWAYKFGPGSPWDYSWGGTYSLGDQWVDTTWGEWKPDGGNAWQGPVSGPWGGYSWQADMSNTAPSISVRGVLKYRSPGGGGPFTDVSDPRTPT